jgi:hypothetical protein
VISIVILIFAPTFFEIADKIVLHTTEALKAYGNAIVPQVMYEIFRAIEETYK